MMEILLTGFCGTSSELLVKKANRILTNFKYSRLKKALEENNLTVHLSDNAGTSFCNALYWNGLDYIYNNRLNAKMVFIHIPFSENITDSELFFKHILRAIENL